MQRHVLANRITGMCKIDRLDVAALDSNELMIPTSFSSNAFILRRSMLDRLNG
jgi:hypothetical protein